LKQSRINKGSGVGREMGGRKRKQLSRKDSGLVQ